MKMKRLNGWWMEEPKNMKKISFERLLYLVFISTKRAIYGCRSSVNAMKYCEEIMKTGTATSNGQDYLPCDDARCEKASFKSRCELIGRPLIISALTRDQQLPTETESHPLRAKSLHLTSFVNRLHFCLNQISEDLSTFLCSNYSSTSHWRFNGKLFHFNEDFGSWMKQDFTTTFYWEIFYLFFKWISQHSATFNLFEPWNFHG